MTNPSQDIWQGNNCGINTAGQYVARTQEEWEQLWTATFSSVWPAPACPALPEGKMAIGIFTGQVSSPATISIKAVDENRAGLEVAYEVQGRSSMLCVMNENFLLQLVAASKADVTFTKVAPTPSTPAKKIDFKKFGPM